MLEHRMGLRSSQTTAQKLTIDLDYFAAFEAQKKLLVRTIKESRQTYDPDSSTQTPDGYYEM